MRAICERFAGLPLLANMVESGRTPVLSKAELEALGYRIAIFPIAAMLAAVKAMSGVYSHLRAHGIHDGREGRARGLRRAREAHGLRGHLGIREAPRRLEKHEERFR
jgi:2-methylisocitrate lyase-like PEP mutase family enzyme